MGTVYVPACSFAYLYLTDLYLASVMHQIFQPLRRVVTQQIPPRLLKYWCEIKRFSQCYACLNILATHLKKFNFFFISNNKLK